MSCTSWPGYGKCSCVVIEIGLIFPRVLENSQEAMDQVLT